VIALGRHRRWRAIGTLVAALTCAHARATLTRAAGWRAACSLPIGDRRRARDLSAALRSDMQASQRALDATCGLYDLLFGLIAYALFDFLLEAMNGHGLVNPQAFQRPAWMAGKGDCRGRAERTLRTRKKDENRLGWAAGCRYARVWRGSISTGRVRRSRWRLVSYTRRLEEDQGYAEDLLRARAVGDSTRLCGCRRPLFAIRTCARASRWDMRSSVAIHMSLISACDR